VSVLARVSHSKQNIFHWPDHSLPMENFDASLVETARALRNGTISTSEYINQIRTRFESVEPDVLSFVKEPNRWKRIKREINIVHQRWPEPDSRPPLFGVPVGVKDIFHVEGLPTQAGSDVPEHVLVGEEATVVSNLKSVGAIVLGKTVTTEFAYFDPGPTRNPHDLNHTPGGSSSGSAAAVAAGLCPFALGSQTIGSVNRPASFCGVVGVKPSYGRVATDGVLPVAPSVDHVGYFTQDIASARFAAGIVYKQWFSGDEPDGQPKLGAVRGPYLSQASDVAQRHFETAIKRFEQAGFDVHRINPFNDIDAINDRHERLVASETALSHVDWYPKYGDLYSSELHSLIEQGLDVDIETLSISRQSRDNLRESIHETLKNAAVDVLLSPGARGPAPAGLNSTGDPVMNAPWTHAGVPTVTVPVSKTDAGLPMAVQCTTHYGRDEWLLNWCDKLETAINAV